MKKWELSWLERQKLHLGRMYGLKCVCLFGRIVDMEEIHLFSHPCSVCFPAIDDLSALPWNCRCFWHVIWFYDKDSILANYLGMT